MDNSNGIILKENKKKNINILQNGLWLYVLQLFNTVIPMLTLPHITRILGSTDYGIFSSALNFIGYLQVIVEYGFNLSGARKVSIADSKIEISKIYSRIIMSKLILFIITFIAMMSMFLITNIDNNQFICIAILFMMVLGTMIQQTWIFQGLQIMKYITVITVVSRIISTILIFTLITDSSDLYLYCVLYAAPFFVSGVISIFIIRQKLNIKMNKIKLIEITEEIKDGWHLFTTSAMTKFLCGIGITVLTITSESNTVGIYSAIQKIPLILTMFYSPISQALYPYISKLYTVSFESGLIKVKKLFSYIMVVAIIIIILIIFQAKNIVYLLYGIEYSEHFRLVYPLMIWVVFSIINNLLGIQILVASGNQKEYSKAFKVGALSIIVLNVLLGKFEGMYGIAKANMISEIILTISIIYQIRKVIKR